MEVPLDFVQPKFLKRKGSISVTSLAPTSSSFELIRSILSVAPANRTEGQIKSLVLYTRNMKFFAELRENVGDVAHSQCCQHLVYAHYPSGKVGTMQIVFNQGDEGTQFFIVLSGSCAILSTTKYGSNQLLTVLRQGECFGELALISNMPRAATVLCREECYFAVLEREAYKKVLGSIQDREHYLRISLLRQHPVFGLCKNDAILRLSHFFKVRILRKKQALFVAGQPAYEVFLVKSGEFQLVQNVLSCSAGKSRKPIRREVHVAMVRPGELLGAVQALGDTNFGFTGYCASQSAEVLCISKKHFRAIVVGEGKEQALLNVEKEREQYWSRQASATLEVKEVVGSTPKITDEVYHKLIAKSATSMLHHARFQGNSSSDSSSLHKSRTDLSQSLSYFPSLQDRSPLSRNNTLKGKLREGNYSVDLGEFVAERSPGKSEKWKERIFKPKNPRAEIESLGVIRNHSMIDLPGVLEDEKEWKKKSQ